MNTLTLLTWSNKSLLSYILDVRILQQMKKILDKFFILWMLQKVFQIYARPLQILMCLSWLSTKFRPMMDMIFLKCLWHFFNTLRSVLEGQASSDLSTISQRPMDANNILILNFLRLNFPPLNLSMILSASISNDAILRLDILLKHSN